MSFLDVIDIFSNLLQIGDKKPETKKPKIFILFYILFVVSIFWFVLELNSLFNLLSPVSFLGLFIVVGLVFTVATIILIYKLNLIEELHKWDFFAILIPMVLLTISLASFINRTYEISKDESIVTISDPLQGNNISRVLVKLDGEEIRIRVPNSIGGILQNGDSLRVEKVKGIMGFEIIRGVKNR